MFESNYPFLGKVFLELLYVNKDFKNSFQAFAPSIYADIESASTNPNCSCRNKIEKYILENKEQSVSFLNNFITQNNLTINIAEIEAKYKTTLYHGKVTDVKIKEWEEFSRKLISERAMYRSFSVMPIDNETVKVFFL
jgi:hypothetical protein